MLTEEKTRIMEGAQAAFFEAMLDGYVGGENRRSVKVRGGDGYTTITYTTEDDKRKVEDRYCTTPFSGKSAGTTTVFCRFSLIWVPVWWMSYGGSYPKKSIDFLRHALSKAYKLRLFQGGRGLPRVDNGLYLADYQESKLMYINQWNGNFQLFEGIEKIFEIPKNGGEDKMIGYHKYWGMSMF